MQFTGSQLLVKRSFYTQNTNFLWSGDLYVDNIDTTYEIGVSGSGIGFGFTLQSGRISQSGLFLHHYYPYESMNLQCELTTSGWNFLKNDTPLIFGATRPSGNYDTLYVKRDSTAGNATFDLFVDGSNAPQYVLSTAGALIATGQTVVTGSFANNSSYPIRVFGSIANATQGLMFFPVTGTIAAGGTGYFSYSGDFNAFDYTSAIFTNVYTNFGDLYLNFYVTDSRPTTRYVYLQDIGSPSFDQNTVMNRNLPYQNFSGGFQTPDFQAGLSFKISYASGSGVFTGVWDLLTGVDSTTLVSLKRPGNYTTTAISGSGLFPANSSVTFQINGDTVNDLGAHGVVLLVSGREVSNPIIQSVSL